MVLLIPSACKSRFVSAELSELSPAGRIRAVQTATRSKEGYDDVERKASRDSCRTPLYLGQVSGQIMSLQGEEVRNISYIGGNLYEH